MLIIEEDGIIIKSTHSDIVACRIMALGGPEDEVAINGIELDRNEMSKLQYALVCFLNTGFFTREA